MATHLDLEEQEQLDQLKAIWQKYGNWVTWLLVVALSGFAAWNGWNWWQRDQAVKAGSMYDQLERAARAGDAAQAARVFDDMKERFAGTAFAQQAGLALAKLQSDKGQSTDALVSLDWVSAHALESEYRTISHLRAAGIQLDLGKPEEALKQLDAATAPEFAPLVADRRGDVLVSQGKKDEAKAAYTQAWQAMEAKVDYRRLIEAKLNALGAVPAASAPVEVPR
jgi:predicted negative regulator of RcsB-dependent stress response